MPFPNDNDGKVRPSCVSWKGKSRSRGQGQDSSKYHDQAMVAKVSGHIANNLVADTNLKVPKGEVHQLIYKDQLLMVVEFTNH